MLYLDNAATTPIDPRVKDAMIPYFTDMFYNPSSVYSPARKVRAALNESRGFVADSIGADSGEVFFTSGGTESDNWAIKGAVVASARGKHIITSRAEHHGVLYLCQHLEKLGCTVTYLPVDSEGFVSPDDVEAAIRPDTCLISLMLANNEVGTINPIRKYGEIARKHGVLLHTDAVQAVGHIPVNVDDLCVDLLTLSAHKFYGPKGIGALYVRKGTKLSPVFHGGAQERNKRAGTENVAGIIGMGAALKICLEEMSEEKVRVSKLRDDLAQAILDGIPHTSLNGAKGENRLPGNVNISFRFIEGESLLLHLDMQGCCASTGSACSSGALDPSHVLMSMGLSHELANGAIRFSLGRGNKHEDIDALMKILAPSVTKLRNLSPLYDDFIKN